MSHDQCPSTVKGEKSKPGKQELAATARAAGTIGGMRAWRSIEDYSDTAEFRDWVEREFPAGASELATAEAGGRETRRDFLKYMGASMALAGAAMIPGCRRPEQKILAYSKNVPEEIIPGKALYYATSFARPDGGAEGLLVETHEGRPTKIEGNPLHPINNGKCSIWAMSSILGLYDPDRLKNREYVNPARGKLDATWEDFRAWAKENIKATDGQGMAFVYGKVSSPSLAAQRAELKKAYKNAKFVAWSPSESPSALAGSKLAFGKAMRESLNITRPKSEGNTRTGTALVVSLDRDFLHFERDELVNARGFATARKMDTTKDDMTRLYVVESGLSLAGGQADHRIRLAPSRVSAFAVKLASRVLGTLADPKAPALRAAIDAVKVPDGADFTVGSPSVDVLIPHIAEDLTNAANRGRSLIVAGESQPPEVHALVIALNAALENIGKAVQYREATEEEASNSGAAMAALVASINSGETTQLVCMGVNPLYDAPGDLGFADAWKKLTATVTLSVERTETADASTWSLNAAHNLESWGDTIASDGTIAPVQPMIAPLYEPAMSELELTALFAGKDFNAKVDGFSLVRSAWQKVTGTVDFERRWRRALHDGVLAGTNSAASAPSPDFGAIAAAVAGLTVGEAPTAQSLEAAFVVGNVGDGRYANCTWLQELPATGTRTVWDNPLLVSPATATSLGLEPEAFTDKDPSAVYTKPKYPLARMAEIKIGSRSITAPVWILPGMADNTVLLTVGYGRQIAGLVADGVGVNVYPLRASNATANAARGVTLAKVSGEHMVASTQNHWSLEGRTSLVRAVDLPTWKKFGDETQKVVDTFYANENRVQDLNFAERLGELSHTPPNISIYTNPYNKSQADPDAKNITPGDPNKPAYQRNTAPEFSGRSQWGMTIDLNSCTGCGACTVACQSENNIPVVGKKEVAKGREMTWIRVDRYFTGDDINNPEAMFHQPVACVQCENAPCEVVCPVNATVHGPEGHNYMVYNRCIGTRYCANNCPYKVRRFNFFDYGVTKFNGSYMGKELIESVAGELPGQEGITGSKVHNKINPNLIPPRVREKLDEISRMKMNPDVTVRSRGVMEKCTYCIQRTNSAKIEIKLQGMEHIPDGFVQTACQQACPSDSIIFGDINDSKSRVHASRANARSYGLLGFLNTRPRTSHMVRVMNPNAKILEMTPEGRERMHVWESPFHHHHDQGHDDGDGQDHAEGEKHGYRIDRRKKSQDRGYALSLNVLTGNPAGVRA